MKFWDSSAVVPLLVTEAMTGVVSEILAANRHMYVWWSTEVECVSALSRLERESAAPSTVIETALDRLAALRREWSEIAAGSAVRDVARRLLRVHPLRAADSLQLGAAWMLADGDPGSVTVVSLDERLRDAARREGFPLLPARPR
jgi:predicted nucleic acid-binding protein